MLVPCRLSPLTLGLSLLFSAAWPAPPPPHCRSRRLPPTASAKDNPRVKEVSTATRTSTPGALCAAGHRHGENRQCAGLRQQHLGKALEGIPNVSSGADTRFDSVRIRGFEASNDFYLDGIRDDSQYIRDLHNIERVEVLKGPAAVLYGRGSQGGIVNRVSKAPEPGRRSTIEAQAGSEDLRSLYADPAQTPATPSACA
jgi:iron complex outermembrane receptor protein